MRRDTGWSLWATPFFFLAILLLVAMSLAGCGENVATPAPAAVPDAVEDEEAILSLPQLEVVSLDGRLLNVVATTDVIGHVVQQIGANRINLVTLMAPGQDPHGFEPSTGDLAAVADADVIFINGWGLEEGLLKTVESAVEQEHLVPISAGITPLRMGHQEEDDVIADHGDIDPHVWLDPHNVIQWADNAAAVLGALEPANAETYQANATAYRTELEDLIDHVEAETMQIPQERRRLVVTHASLAYFAQRFDFHVVGAVIPGTSTLAEPPAGSLALLITAMRAARVCTLFVESTVNPALAETVAGELDTCDKVQILELYTGSLGPEESRAATYIGMMRANVNALVRGLAG